MLTHDVDATTPIVEGGELCIRMDSKTEKNNTSMIIPDFKN